MWVKTAAVLEINNDSFISIVLTNYREIFEKLNIKKLMSSFSKKCYHGNLIHDYVL